MEKGEGGKVGGGTRCRGGVRAATVGEGRLGAGALRWRWWWVGARTIVGHRATKDQVIKTVLFLAHVSIIRPS